ncbi:MAG: hypothetical protein DRQ59_04350 [Gammaproteobacteria bacterium]|nr:MAG: hypothetical protein DRQ59_04350 [Gammaproteobacteria bacterium]
MKLKPCLLLRHYLLAWLFFTIGSMNVEAGVSDVSIEPIDRTNFRLTIAGSQLEVNIRDKVLLSKQDILLEWIKYSAQVVHQYYGRFPVDRLKIELNVAGGFAVRFGQAFGGESPHLRIVVGEDINAEMLRKDWIMVHEMVHLAMADVPRSNRWLLEGLATYVESIARAQQGYLSEEFVWNGFINRMPQGLPAAGDEGLDHTPTWGRTYWGGAMFCLLADIEIRRLTNNQMSLRDALRGILSDGYSMESDATPMQIFKSGDAATGVPVLVNLYQKMRADPMQVDLQALWVDLGVDLKNDRVVYNAEASLAYVREQMLKP